MQIECKQLGSNAAIYELVYELISECENILTLPPVDNYVNYLVL